MSRHAWGSPRAGRGRGFPRCGSDRGRGGELVPVEVGHYYGDLSHAVVVEPTVDWDPEAAYTVVVGAGLMDFDGVTYDGEWTATFSTGEEPPPVEPPEDDGCSCASTAARGDGAWVLLLLPWVRRRR